MVNAEPVVPRVAQIPTTAYSWRFSFLFLPILDIAILPSAALAMSTCINH